VATALVQHTGATWNNTTGGEKDFAGNVTSGNLVSVQVECWTNATNHPPVAGDVTAEAGSTATIGTVTLDKVATYTNGSQYWHVAIWSAPVTGTGTLTMVFVGVPDGSYGAIGIAEYSGADVTASRVEGTNSATGTSTAPNSGNVTSAGGAVFVGSLAFGADAAVTIAEDAAFAKIWEEEYGVMHQPGAFEDRCVAGATTDAATWTLGSSKAWLAALAVYKVAAAGEAALTGTALPSMRAGAVRTTGKTIIVTISGDTWIA
jgi:hypothetical protein